MDAETQNAAILAATSLAATNQNFYLIHYTITDKWYVLGNGRWKQIVSPGTVYTLGVTLDLCESVDVTTTADWNNLVNAFGTPGPI